MYMRFYITTNIRIKIPGNIHRSEFYNKFAKSRFICCICLNIENIKIINIINIQSKCLFRILITAADY
jgi:hypothetical protein